MYDIQITSQEYALFQRLIYKIAGISLSDKRVIWVNPDDLDQDARPYPDATQERSK